MDELNGPQEIQISQLHIIISVDVWSRYFTVSCYLICRDALRDHIRQAAASLSIHEINTLVTTLLLASLVFGHLRCRLFLHVVSIIFSLQYNLWHNWESRILSTPLPPLKINRLTAEILPKLQISKQRMFQILWELFQFVSVVLNAFPKFFCFIM